MDIKLYIREWRLTEGISQVVLSRNTGLSQAAISDIENGGRDVTLSTITRLAEGLEISPEKLFSPPFNIPRKLSRMQIDKVASAIVEEKEIADVKLRKIRDDISLLVIGKLKAQNVPGAKRVMGKRLLAPRRLLWIREKYPEGLIRQVLSRVDKYLASHAA